MQLDLPLSAPAKTTDCGATLRSTQRDATVKTEFDVASKTPTVRISSTRANADSF